ncbi:hypothetical protein AB0J38_02200 [Streptomyces sp. NPDC050095]|uniref:hypothetical protein n=1 Tax=unclassified Streptomyces TaxID=2593676 RepID=UPI0034133F57
MNSTPPSAAQPLVRVPGDTRPNRSTIWDGRTIQPAMLVDPELVARVLAALRWMR